MKLPEPRSIVLTRREAIAALAAMAMPVTCAADTRDSAAPYALPGRYRSRVVQVTHPGSVVDGAVQRDAVRGMMERGMRALTGAPDEAAAWKRFFKPGDVVGVKVAPVGYPHAISQPETLLEVFRCLNLAGIPNTDIVLFNRYEEEILQCGYDKILPMGVKWAAPSFRAEGTQTGLEGYDPTAYVEMERVMPSVDPKDPVNHRSHLSMVASRQVTKIVNVCALKDHASAGLTMALKNMSHGFVNNVCRSHADHETNWCDTFIPTVVAMPRIRQKVVLHICDGLVGCFDGGPGVWNPHFRTWEYRSLFFGTDPVAMDRVGWSILDAKRAAEGLPLLAQTGMAATNPGHEQFDRRQPEHVLLAGQAGLGEADLKRIDWRRLTLNA